MSAAAWFFGLAALVIAVNAAAARWLRRRSRRLPVQPLPPERIRRAGGTPAQDVTWPRDDPGDDLGQVLGKAFHDMDAELDKILRERGEGRA